MSKGSTLGKDPAVSWVFNDWQGGTMTLSRFLKGCYMDLLTAQFNNGHLSLDEIKTVLGGDFPQSWGTLSKKFKQDSDGLYYNERLEFEINKRKDYNKSRRNNLKSGSNEGDSSPHMGNGNGIEIRKGNFILEVYKHRGEFSEKLIETFISYWTEPNKSGTKLRFEDQKFFDLKKRLATFRRNDEKFKKPEAQTIDLETQLKQKHNVAS